MEVAHNWHVHSLLITTHYMPSSFTCIVGTGTKGKGYTNATHYATALIAVGQALEAAGLRENETLVMTRVFIGIGSAINVFVPTLRSDLPSVV